MAIGSLIGLAILGLSMSVAPLSNAANPAKAISSRNFNVAHKISDNYYEDISYDYEVTNLSPAEQDTDGNYIYYDESGTYGQESKWISYRTSHNLEQIDYNCFHISFDSQSTTYYLKNNDGLLEVTTTAPNSSNSDYYFVIKNENNLSNERGIDRLSAGERQNVYIYSPKAKAYINCSSTVSRAEPVIATFSSTEPTLLCIDGSTGKIALSSDNDVFLSYRDGSFCFAYPNLLDLAAVFQFSGESLTSGTTEAKVYERVTSAAEIENYDNCAIVGQQNSNFYAISTVQYANNREAVLIHTNSDSAEIFGADQAPGLCTFRIEYDEIEPNYYAFNDFERNTSFGGYLSAGDTGSHNRLITVDSIDDSAKWELRWQEDGTINFRNIVVNKLIGLNVSGSVHVFSSYALGGSSIVTSLYLYRMTQVTRYIEFVLPFDQTFDAEDIYSDNIKPLYYYIDDTTVYEPLDLTPAEINGWIRVGAIKTIKATPVLRSINLLSDSTVRVLRGDTKRIDLERHPYYANESLNFEFDNTIMGVSTNDGSSTFWIYGQENGVSTLTIRGESGIVEESMTIKICSITNVEIETKPQTEFAVGDDFTYDGLEIRVYYSDSTSEVISDGFSVAIAPDMTTAGNKTVRLMWNFEYFEYQIHVSNLTPTHLYVNGPTSYLHVGDTFQLTWTFSPQYATESVNITNNSNMDVASVNGDFLVTALSMGVTYITLRSASGLTDVAEIRVLDGTEHVELHEPDREIFVGDTYHLEFTLYPTWIDDESFEYHVSDTQVVTIDQYDVLSAHKAGTVTITIENNVTDHNIFHVTDSIQLTVLDGESFSLKEHSVTIEVGKTKTLEYELHTKQSNVTISGTSNNASVASVNNFVISANSIGYTTIIFTTNIGLSDVCMVSVVSPSEEPGDNPSGDEGEGEETPQEGEDGKPDDEEPSNEGEGHSGEPDSGEGNTPDKGSDTTPDSENKEQENMTVGVVAGVVAISIVGGTVGTVVGVTIHKKKKAKKS